MAALSGTARHRPAVFAVAVLASALVSAAAGAAPDSTVIDHGVWTELLQHYVDEDGMVAYRRLEAEARARRAAYLNSLAELDPSPLPPKERMAFWINAYNAAVVNGILAGQSPEGVLSRKRFFGWYTTRIAGRDRTLDEIENTILRQEFHDPRIHMALVCGASSCPRLRREAYVGARLDEQLDDQARWFVNDPRRNRVDPVIDQLELSSIFKWFAADFGGEDGVRAFVARYASWPDQAALAKRTTVPVRYLDYDWTLNAQSGQRPTD
jgi:hypothetical protein